MKANTKTHTTPESPNKKSYKVTNWHEYNEALVARGSVTVWLSDDVLVAWNQPIHSGKAGHPKTYSDIAIQTALTMQAIYHLPLRATEGFVQSLLFLLGCGHLKSPDYSTLSYRSEDLTVLMSARVRQVLVSGEDLHIAVDSTGVKLYGEGEWKVRKHGWSKRRAWRKVHLGVDVSTNLIPASALTESEVADGHMVEPLLDHMPDECRVDTLYGDGAYDHWDLYDLCQSREITLLAPPRANAVDLYLESGERGYHPSQTIRNQAVLYAEKHGITRWKTETGYHKRSLSETAMYRLKAIFGANITARTLGRQQTQIQVRIQALNEMTLLGMPKFVMD